jgi:restriction system protein
MKHLWLVRLGRNGEQEPHALEHSELVLGFKLADLTNAKDRDAILAIAQGTWPDHKPKTLLNYAAQLNQFCNTMQRGDLVVVPLKSTSQIAIGEVAGDYKPAADNAVSRKVKWLKTDVPREAFRQDLLFSFGATMTVCEISRNDALRRVEATLKTGTDPGFESGIEKVAKAANGPLAEPTGEGIVDLAEIARDQIERKIASAFTGHNFARLVDEILKAQGYLTNLSPPGADNGIDIVAGKGPLGFDAPRLVVQVKSGTIDVDQPTLQALIGAVQDVHAEHGLLVSWGGFKQTVAKRRNELYFRIRLWGRKEIVDALFEVYDKLPEEFRAELPLRRTYTLVPDADQEAV